MFIMSKKYLSFQQQQFPSYTGYWIVFVSLFCCPSLLLFARLFPVKHAHKHMVYRFIRPGFNIFLIEKNYYSWFDKIVDCVWKIPIMLVLFFFARFITISHHNHHYYDDDDEYLRCYRFGPTFFLPPCCWTGLFINNFFCILFLVIGHYHQG